MFGRLALRLDDTEPIARQALSLALCDGEDYRAVLTALHGVRAPRCYAEVGVLNGETLALANTDTYAIGIDPNPRIDRALRPRATVYAETSDEFFRRWDERPELARLRIDMAFIDGLHLFEQALRDFIHIEERSDSDGIIVLHDVLPADRRSAARVRDADWWTGDVWKITLALRRHRPDLRLSLARMAPTGLLLVSNLSPRSGTLRASFAQIVAEFVDLDFARYTREIRSGLGGAARTADEVAEALRSSPADESRRPT